MINGSAILKPSIQPGYGWLSADSTIAGRTMLTLIFDPRSSTVRSAIALAKV